MFINKTHVSLAVGSERRLIYSCHIFDYFMVLMLSIKLCFLFLCALDYSEALQSQNYMSRIRKSVFFLHRKFAKVLIFWILFLRCPFLISAWTHCSQWGFPQFPQTNSFVIDSVPFIVSPCIAALSHRKPASADTSRGICRARGNCKGNTLYLTSDFLAHYLQLVNH